MSEYDQKLFLTVHERLRRAYDVDAWHWQLDTPPLDVCLGAILVQHTAWTNVEKALSKLKDAGTCSLESIAALVEGELALLIRPAGMALTKAKRLQTFARLVLTNGGFECFFRRPEAELRSLFLSTPGIGPETANAILLYAAGKPAIVHDAYTARLFRRVGIGPERGRYEDWRAWLDALLPTDIAVRRAHHAAIVMHCKAVCRARPLCAACPLNDLCDYGATVTASAS